MSDEANAIFEGLERLRDDIVFDSDAPPAVVWTTRPELLGYPVVPADPDEYGPNAWAPAQETSS